VIVIDTGSYGGATITKSVKVNVPVGVVAFTAATMTVAAGASDVVVLRGLTIKALTPGTGTGISYASGAALYVENCVIDGWERGLSVTTSGATKVFLADTTIRNVSFLGLDVNPVTGAPDVSVDNARFENSANCAVIVFQGVANVLRSIATGSEFGFCAVGGTVNVEGSMASGNNSDGFVVNNGGVLRATKCIATRNGVGFDNAGSTFESLGDNLVRGNGTNVNGTITVVAGQ
jgi:hypothetical protein